MGISMAWVGKSSFINWHIVICTEDCAMLVVAILNSVCKGALT